MGTKNTATEVTVELSDDHVHALTAGSNRTLEESVHRAIRLYRELDNPDELLAESDLNEATQ